MGRWDITAINIYDNKKNYSDLVTDEDLDAVVKYDIVLIPTIILVNRDSELYRWEDVAHIELITNKIKEYEIPNGDEISFRQLL